MSLFSVLLIFGLHLITTSLSRSCTCTHFEEPICDIDTSCKWIPQHKLCRSIRWALCEMDEECSSNRNPVTGEPDPDWPFDCPDYDPNFDGIFIDNKNTNQETETEDTTESETKTNKKDKNDKKSPKDNDNDINLDSQTTLPPDADADECYEIGKLKGELCECSLTNVCKGKGCEDGPQVTCNNGGVCCCGACADSPGGDNLPNQPTGKSSQSGSNQNTGSPGSKSGQPPPPPPPPGNMTNGNMTNGQPPPPPNQGQPPPPSGGQGGQGQPPPPPSGGSGGQGGQQPPPPGGGSAGGGQQPPPPSGGQGQQPPPSGGSGGGSKKKKSGGSTTPTTLPEKEINALYIPPQNQQGQPGYYPPQQGQQGQGMQSPLQQPQPGQQQVPQPQPQPPLQQEPVMGMPPPNNGYSSYSAYSAYSNYNGYNGYDNIDSDKPTDNDYANEGLPPDNGYGQKTYNNDNDNNDNSNWMALPPRENADDQYNTYDNNYDNQQPPAQPKPQPPQIGNGYNGYKPQPPPQNGNDNGVYQSPQSVQYPPVNNGYEYDNGNGDMTVDDGNALVNIDNDIIDNIHTSDIGKSLRIGYGEIFIGFICVVLICCGLMCWNNTRKEKQNKKMYDDLNRLVERELRHTYKYSTFDRV